MAAVAQVALRRASAGRRVAAPPAVAEDWLAPPLAVAVGPQDLSAQTARLERVVVRQHSFRSKELVAQATNLARDLAAMEPGLREIAVGPAVVQKGIVGAREGNRSGNDLPFEFRSDLGLLRSFFPVDSGRPACLPQGHGMHLESLPLRRPELLQEHKERCRRQTHFGSPLPYRRIV